MSGLRWSDPATWPNGQVPNRFDNVIIPAGRIIELDMPNAEALQLRVYGVLTKRASTNVQLTMYGNLIVDQTGLVDFSRPDGSTWLVRFIVPSESQFAGGGMVPIDSDIGWWVVGSGRVNLQGDPKTPWTRLTGAASAGATSITVQNATGWRVGDEIAIVPSESPTVDMIDHYDVRTITAISGATITLSAALTYPHPAVTFPVFTNGVLQPTTFTAEVLNLTRTGRIEGRPGLRTHFFVHNTSAVVQTLRYVQFRYFGPRKTCTPADQCDSRQVPFGVGVLGRWGGVHFHMNGDLSNGSLVEGTVTRDFGSHAYVPHDSNGLTFRANIAHDGFEEAFWWDLPPLGPLGSHHMTLDGNAASRVARVGNPAQQITGFWLGHGDNNFYNPSVAPLNVAINNVAVGIQGAGFVWPEVGSGQWRFDAGNVAHNNASQGIFGWINNMVSTIANFVAYYNQGAGIDHGAYANTFLFRDITLYGNGPGYTNFRMQAISASGTDTGLRVVRLYEDGLGLCVDGMLLNSAVFPPLQPVWIVDSQFRGNTRAAITIDWNDRVNPWLLDVRGVTVVGNRYWIDPTTPPGTLIRDNDLRLNIRRFDQPGTLVPQWNARTTPQ